MRVLLAPLCLVLLACGDDVADTTTGQDGPPTTVPDPSTDTTDAPTSTAPTPTVTGDATTSDTTAISTTTSTTRDTTTTTAATTGPICGEMTCSADLQAVLCDGLIDTVCPPGSLCVDAACQPATPCEAAALRQRSEGCEFYAVKTEVVYTATGSCFAAFIANTGDQPVELAVEYEGLPLPVAEFTRIPSGQGDDLVYLPYDADLGLPAGEVAILSLSRGPGDLPDCPAPPAIPEEIQALGSARGAAFRITADLPVAAYQMLPYGGGTAALTAATLLLPTGAWGTNYIAVNPYARSDIADTYPLLAVVAAEDDTVITLDPRVDVVAGDQVAGGPAGVPIEYTLARGETLQIGQPAELTGSPLASNKPFGLFGGANCMNIPVDVASCDASHQQIPPVRALGSAYAAVRHGDRVDGQFESPPWRLVGAVDGTQLSYVPAKPPGAPDTLELGELAEFSAPGPFMVASQDVDHPFYFAAYMTGGWDYGQIGDPEWVNVIPAAQYLERYVFFTDPTYPDTSLVVVRNREDGVFAPVELECLGELDGWLPLGDDHEWTRVVLVRGNFEAQGDCTNGRHVMTSASPFGVTVWGWGSNKTIPDSLAVSYAYPAGAAVRPINDVIITPG